MNSAAYEQVRSLFLAARDLSAEGRRALLESEASRIDPAVLEEVRGLLAQEVDGFLDRPVLRAEFRVADAPPPLPARIGPYSVKASLSEGPVSRVLLGEDPSGGKVAIKILRPGTADPEVRARFEAERAALARLDHPHLARAIDSGVSEETGGSRGMPFLVTRYVDGVSLTEYGRDRALPLRDRLALFLRVCEGVHHAHQRGILHRDLKPANILVEATSEGPVPRVIDFGVAKALDGRLGPGTLTIRGQIVGTLPYMSPEQVSGKGEEVDTRTDVYALGVLLFELAAGRLPLDLDGLPLLEAVRLVTTTDPPRLGALRQELRGDLETIAAKALSKDKDLRYPSVSELGADVGRYLRREPIAARPPSIPYILRKLASRHRRLVVALFAAALVLAVTLGRWILAERESARNYRSSQLFADSLLDFLVDDAVAQSPGLGDRRRAKLEEFRALSLRLSERKGEGPEDVARRGNLLSALGQLYVTSGRRPEGESLLLDALEARRRQREISPEDPSTLLELSLALVRVGDARRAAGDVVEALRRYREALPMDEDLVRSDPGNRRYRSQLGWSYERVANLTLETRDFREAERLFRLQASVFEQMAAEDPDDADAAAGLSASHRHFYALADRLKDSPRMREHSRLALLQAERVAALRPHSRPAQVALCAALCTAGGMASDACDLDTAEACGSRALSLARELESSDPRDSFVLFELAESHGLLSSVADRRGDPAGSITELRDAAAALERARAVQPEERSIARFLAAVRRDLAAHHLETASPSQALEEARRALAIRRFLAEEPPECPSDGADLAALLLDCPVLEIRDPVEALRWAERAVALSPRDPRFHEIRSDAAAATGDVVRAANDLEEALRLVPSTDADERWHLASKLEERRRNDR